MGSFSHSCCFFLIRPVAHIFTLIVRQVYQKINTANPLFTAEKLRILFRSLVLAHLQSAFLDRKVKNRLPTEEHQSTRFKSSEYIIGSIVFPGRLYQVGN